jgi:hypothetical protein
MPMASVITVADAMAMATAAALSTVQSTVTAPLSDRIYLENMKRTGPLPLTKYQWRICGMIWAEMC